MKLIKVIISILIMTTFGFIAYKWDKKRKLDTYFIEQFALDRQTQISRNEAGHGELFEKALQQMEKEHYNPQEIYDIMVKGFDKASSSNSSSEITG